MGNRKREKLVFSIDNGLLFFHSLYSNITEMRKSYGEAFQKRHGLKLSFMSAFIKATAYALSDQPVVNAVIDGTDVVYRDYVDISVAVATPKVSFLTFKFSA